MLVNELQNGMLINVQEGYSCFLQDSSSSSLPRLRTAPNVIAHLITGAELIDCDTIMYLGESKKHISKKSSLKKIRTVMINGQIAFVEGRDFRKFDPIF